MKMWHDYDCKWNFGHDCTCGLAEYLTNQQAKVSDPPIDSPLQRLLNKVNKVTAPWRHGRHVDEKAMDELVVRQIEIEGGTRSPSNLEMVIGVTKPYTWTPHDGVSGHGTCAQVFSPDGRSFFEFDPGPYADEDAQALCDRMNMLVALGAIRESVVCKHCGHSAGAHAMDTFRCPNSNSVGGGRWIDTTFQRFVVYPNVKEPDDV